MLMDSKAMKSAKVGSVITFGRFPQGKRGKVKPIEWRVLKKEEDGTLFLISEKALEYLDFDGFQLCPLFAFTFIHLWLNDYFFNKAFTEKERELIRVTAVDNSPASTGVDDNPNTGPDTKDFVFPLSIKEVNELFKDEKDRQCKPTDYAISHGISIDEGGNCVWWLRSPFPEPDTPIAYCVDEHGDISYDYLDIEFGIRPAIRILP